MGVRHETRHKACHQLQIIRTCKNNLFRCLYFQFFKLQGTIEVGCCHFLILGSILHQINNRLNGCIGIIKSFRPQRTTDGDGIVGL